MKFQIGLTLVLILFLVNLIKASDKNVQDYLDEQEKIHNFPIKHLDYKQIVETFYQLEKEYPHYIKVYDARSEFKNETLPKVYCSNTQNPEDLCKFIYAVITNYSDPKHVNFTQSFFSGNFHGDEVVGPNILTYMAKYILEKPDLNILSKSYLVILPMGNPQGYSQYKREECQNGNRICFDMNRDFPYDTNEKCFQTAGARIINYIWKKYLFTASITFHGGMTAIGWPWGSNNHLTSENKGQICPDQNAFYILGKRMSEVGGQYPGIPKYRYDILNDVVYPVNGSFEDWSYAASWERYIDPSFSSFFPKCERISDEELQINNNTARSLTYLIETTDKKQPPESTYGTWQQIQSNDKGQGHVTRNIRLTLDFINNLSPSYEVATHNSGNYTFYVKWAVEGCHQVSNTKFLIRENDQQSNIVKNSYYSLQQLLDDGFKIYSEYTDYQGKLKDITSFKSQVVQFDDPKDRLIDIAIFSECDSFLTEKVSSAEPIIEPQSHFVRSRSNASYLAENNGFFINSNKYIIKSLGPFEVNNNIYTDSSDLKNQPSKQKSDYDYLIAIFSIVTVGALISYCIYKKFDGFGANNVNFQELHDDDHQLQQLPNSQQQQNQNQLKRVNNKEGGVKKYELTHEDDGL
ncbi:zinc carboxypeptidase (macronuclear) [Tetrahymena thermophila SB210]|uniref:Zinc carboxypeptidase n=1 Tax=Tetrahymena thermophila (strain SB210) TaxID=312017 RepID=Q24GJ2_TETTS|nr:zinc carboxypeptidase [Tetrahymena thermophila SB210]EAS06879.2 zinc carboxypeptidase [Tetrahymena thermophila SB210]|eukprot:XP_001027121.2 zinc carboxypeptidase [Tetrahymena thermophila SB210]